MSLRKSHPIVCPIFSTVMSENQGATGRQYTINTLNRIIDWTHVFYNEPWIKHSRFTSYEGRHSYAGDLARV